ncbi:MAG: alpha/beta hydrolase family esterase, partial [Solirubrobacteraceae bacterium]
GSQGVGPAPQTFKAVVRRGAVAAVTTAFLAASAGGVFADGGATGDEGTATTPTSDARPAPVIYRPAGLNRTKRVPLVVALNPSGGTPVTFEAGSGLDTVADQYGFVVAYLGQPPPVSPAWRRVDLAANLSYISSEIKQLTVSESIDPTRVYITGFSAGATMSLFAACELSDQIDGVAAVSGAMLRSGEPCRISHPVSEMLVIGTNDIIPIAGSSHLYSAAQVSAGWRARNDCATKARRSASGPVSLETWSTCNDRAGVGLYVVNGGVHAWPGAPGLTGPDSQYDAAQAVWAFFSAHPGDIVTRVSAKLSSLREGADRRVVAVLDTGEPVQVSASLTIGATVLARKPVSLPRGAAVRLALTAPSGHRGRGSLRLALSDSYGRRSTISRALSVR